MNYLKLLPYYFILLVIKLIVLLPKNIALAIGDYLGNLLFFLLKYRRKICQKNIQIAFPELNAEEKNELLKKHFHSIGKGIIEMGFAWFYTEKKLRAITDLYADTDSLKLLTDPKTPVILVGAHSTLLELGVRCLGLHVLAGGMYRPIKNIFFNQWIKKQRERASNHIELIHFKDMRRTLDYLHNGGNLWYAADQDMGGKVSVFAPFFNVPTASIDIFSKLQAKTGAHLVPVYIWRNADRYEVRILAEIKDFSDNVDLMQQINAHLETQIREFPDQYYWLHRRFKTLPDGSRREY